MLSPETRQRVALRAQHSCEYCLVHQDDSAFVHEIDHIIGRKHQGSDADDNLAYACFLCNRYKGSDLASLDESGALAALFHPRRQAWHDHFSLQGARLTPRTPVAEATIRLLRLNDSSRLALRAELLERGRYPGRPANQR